MKKQFPITTENGKITCPELKGYELPEIERFEFTRQDLVDLVQSLKDYTAESHNILGHDEREASEFVDIFLNGRNRTPIAIEVEMVEVGRESIPYSDLVIGVLHPATNQGGTVKVVKWIFNE